MLAKDLQQLCAAINAERRLTRCAEHRSRTTHPHPPGIVENQQFSRMFHYKCSNMLHRGSLLVL
jgi:hypothetical protein